MLYIMTITLPVLVRFLSSFATNDSSVAIREEIPQCRGDTQVSLSLRKPVISIEKQEAPAECFEGEIS